MTETEPSELVEKWRRWASDGSPDTNWDEGYDTALQSCANELEMALGEVDPQPCGSYHPLPCSVDKDCPETDGDGGPNMEAQRDMDREVR